MKTLLLLSGVAWLSACGSSSGTPPTDLQAQPVPAASQAPQQPADSVPPINSQQPAINSQQPPPNSQQPPINSQQPSPAVQPPGTAITCDQIAAAASADGCPIDSATLAVCVAATASNSPCAAEWQAVLGCAMQVNFCDSTGSVDFSSACPNQIGALNTCANQAGNCTVSTFCTGCSGACALCQCGRAADQTLNCTQPCQTN